VVDTVALFAKHAKTVQDVHDAINSAYTDETDRSCINLMSTHKAKGDEADNVWLLADSFAYFRYVNGTQYKFEQGVKPDTEDENLAYVAVTRARKTLHLVVGTRFFGKEKYIEEDES
jgi:superfamily I DNA/RNA helicase